MRTILRFSLIAGVVVVAPAASVAQQIVVGPNVQISAARARDAHSEPGDCQRSESTPSV